MEAARERLKRLVAYAETKGARILLENHTQRPEKAEIHYIPVSFAEWRYFFDGIQSPHFRLSFTANHAHLIPEGVAGFCDALDFGRVDEVRLRRLRPARSRGAPQARRRGSGLRDMFRRIEGKGFTGHYTNAFGTLDDMLAARDYLVAKAAAAGVK